MMRHAISIAVINLFISSLFAFEADSVIKFGNDSYANGLYYYAIEAYKQAIDSGYKAPGLYYNLGNAYYKINNIPLAILNYERAKKLDPYDDDISHNLTLANAHVVDKIDVIPEFIIKTWIRNIVSLADPDRWAVISISAFLLFLVLFLIYLFSARIALKKFTFWLGILILFISASAFYSALKRKELLTAKDSAIIISPTVTAKSSPAESGVDLFIIHEGTKIIIEDSLDIWNRIRIGDGTVGWIRKEDMEII
jgi:tetratricopeptide (TPR) repeat protein